MERVVDEQNKDLPWMSLLLIREEEFKQCEYYPIAESTEIDNSSDSVPIKLLEIPSNLLKSIAPTSDEVELLAHGLQVNPRDKELCGNDEDGFSQRFCQTVYHQNPMKNIMFFGFT